MKTTIKTIKQQIEVYANRIDKSKIMTVTERGSAKLVLSNIALDIADFEKELREDLENTVIKMNTAFGKEEGAEAMACSGRLRLIREILADKDL